MLTYSLLEEGLEGALALLWVRWSACCLTWTEAFWISSGMARTSDKPFALQSSNREHYFLLYSSKRSASSAFSTPQCIQGTRTQASSILQVKKSKSQNQRLADPRTSDDHLPKRKKWQHDNKYASPSKKLANLSPASSKRYFNVNKKKRRSPSNQNTANHIPYRQNNMKTNQTVSLGMRFPPSEKPKTHTTASWRECKRRNDGYRSKICILSKWEIHIEKRSSELSRRNSSILTAASLIR